MNRSLASLLLGTTLSTPLAANTAVPQPPPNIVVILADDLGYADLGAQGSTEVITPRIDSIAKNGMRFTDAYVTASQCSPSRAGLVTGRYQQRFGYDVNLGPDLTMDGKLGLPADQPTLAEILKKAGYSTGIIGKWDLGAGPDFHPNRRGFDEFFGFLGGSRHHFPMTAEAHGEIFFNKLERNGEFLTETGWSSDIYGAEAADFIQRHAGDPFFLFVSFTAPHWPMQAREEDLAKFGQVSDLHRRTFLAMMAGLDRGVGEVLDAIQKAGIRERTLVIFLSDNGGAVKGRPGTKPGLGGFPGGVNTSKNDPLRGQKGDLLEGGVRISFFSEWPGTIPAGTVSSVPVTSLDIAATAAALAGADVRADRALDGVNLFPLLTGKESKLPPRDLFWRVKNQSAIRSGDWKLLQIGSKPPELYNLADDIGESNNLIEKEPETAARLRDSLTRWLDTLVPPAW